jgi:hypothetical protein
MVALEREIGVRYAEVFVDTVPTGAEEMDVSLELPVELVAVPLDTKEVIKFPPKRTDEEMDDWTIVSTDPFNPPKGASTKLPRLVEYNLTPPSKSPPIQTL